MPFPIEKWIKNGLPILFILSIFIIIPLPFNEEQVNHMRINDDQWKFVCVNEGEGCSYYPTKSGIMGSKGFINIVSQPGSESYVESEVDLPDRSSTFMYFTKMNQLPSTTILFDSKNTPHVLTEKPPDENTRRNPYKMEVKEFDISQYAGQKVTIRIKPMSSPPGVAHGYYHHDYGGMTIHVKKYTLYDNFIIFLNTLLYIILFSLIVGFIMGFSGLPFFIHSTDRSHAWVTKNYNSFSKGDKWYTKYYLKTIFFIANKSLQYADKIHDIKLRTWIKIALMVGLPIMVIYITKVIMFIMILITITILILAVLLWIIMDLVGGSPSGGSVGGGAGSSSGSRPSSPIFETHKIEKSFFTDDKSLKDKSGNKVGSISKSFWDDDRQIIKDANGKQAGDIRTSFWDDDRQVIRDSSGEHAGDIRTSFWSGERIIEDEEGEKHGTIRKNWAGETIIDDEK